MNKLNLTKEIISDKYKLKEWVDMVYEIITTDISEHMINEANLAIKNLKILYYFFLFFSRPRKKRVILNFNSVIFCIFLVLGR